MTEFEKDLQQENTYPEMRKGFKGFWWNFFNCGKLSKEDQKKVMKKTLIGGLIAMAALIVLITAGIFAVMGISRAIENSKPYSQVKIEDFRKNWNAAATADPDGITEGVNLTKGDVSDSYNILSTEDSWIAISRCGRDFETISYTSEQYRDLQNRAAILTEILKLCMPDIDHTQAVQEHLQYEAKYVQTAIDGFKIEFSEVDNKEDIEYKIYMEYEYSNNIIAANTLTGCAFDCTLREFVTNYNKIVNELFGENSQYLSMSNLPNTPSRTETYGDINIDVYTYSYYNGTTEVGAIAFYVERNSGEICQLRYTLGCNAYDNMSDELKIGYKEDLTKAIFGAIGFSEYSVYDDYFMEAVKSTETGCLIIKEGAQAGAGIIKEGNTEMFCFEMYAYGEGEKKISSNSDTATNGKESDDELSTDTETDSAEPIETITPDENSQTPAEHTFLVKSWSGAASDNLSLSINVAEFDSTYKIEGILTLLDNGTSQNYTQDLNLSPDGEGNYYIKFSADQEYELWFYIQDEQTINCTLYWENGASASFSLN